MSLQQRTCRAHRSASGAVLLRPVLKAYVLGYLTSTVPRLPNVIRTIHLSRLTIEQKLNLLRKALTGAIGLNRFPTSCAIIVGGCTVLPSVLTNMLLWLHRVLPSNNLRRFLSILRRRSVFICSFGSAWISFSLLNRDNGWTRKRANSIATRFQMQPAWSAPNQHHLPPPSAHMHYAGKTIDFTLFAACRAIDVLVISAWSNAKRAALCTNGGFSNLSQLLRRLADPCVFSISSAVIMWSWFYSPERLPKTYNHWIAKIAHIDTRLINALRLCRQGELVYGKKETQDASLPSLCEELGLPASWGDPSSTVPIPCELYHCGAGKSCEKHASKRFSHTFILALQLYLPLQMLSILRRRQINTRLLKDLLKDAIQSSSFLASFVALFYYGVCLARTRLGPKLCQPTTITPQMWDSGLCVLAGCLACGWSILLEKSSRRQDIAFFVAPRALATLLPRVYNAKYQKREQVIFSTSVAIVMSAMQGSESKVRGVLGRILATVLK